MRQEKAADFTSPIVSSEHERRPSKLRSEKDKRNPERNPERETRREKGREKGGERRDGKRREKRQAARERIVRKDICRKTGREKAGKRERERERECVCVCVREIKVDEKKRTCVNREN